MTDDTDNVTPLRPHAPANTPKSDEALLDMVKDAPPKPANEDLIMLLEDMLARAKSGDMISGAFAGILSDGRVISSFSSSKAFVLDVGAVSYLLHSMHKKMESS